MKKFLSRSGAAATLLVMLLAACGGGGSARDPAPPPDQPFVRLQRFDGGVSTGLVAGPGGTVFGLARSSLFSVDATGTVSMVREYRSTDFAAPDCFTTVSGLTAGPTGDLLFNGLPCSDEVSELGSATPQGVYTRWDRAYPATLGAAAADAAGHVYVTSAGDWELSGLPSFVQRMDGPRDRVWRVDFDAAVGLEFPAAPLSPAADGWMVGVAQPYAGVGEESTRRNAVFRIDADGRVQTVRVLLPGDGVGQVLLPGLSVDAAGWITGVSTQGGDNGYGSVWRMRSDGSALAALHHFDGPGANGQLLRAADGRIYGTVGARGDVGGGVIYRIGTDGSFSVLHVFASASQQPFGPLLLQGGMLYGTTRDNRGGAGAAGELYRLRIPD